MKKADLDNQPQDIFFCFLVRTCCLEWPISDSSFLTSLPSESIMLIGQFAYVKPIIWTGVDFSPPSFGIFLSLHRARVLYVVWHESMTREPPHQLSPVGPQTSYNALATRNNFLIAHSHWFLLQERGEGWQNSILRTGHHWPWVRHFMQVLGIWI